MDSLDRLDSAIQARIAKENDFIQRITDEFRQISAGIARTAASSSPQVQADLAPFIQRIDAATALLKTRPFGDDYNLEGLVRNVKGRGNPPPSSSGFFNFMNTTPRPATPAPRPRYRTEAERIRGDANAQRQAVEASAAANDGFYDAVGPPIPERTQEQNQANTAAAQTDSMFSRLGFTGGKRGGWTAKRTKRSRRSRRPH